MSDKKNLENIKKLREITGVGFSDCKLAIAENGGDIDKSIEYLRKKGIAKATKKMRSFNLQILKYTHNIQFVKVQLKLKI